MADVFLHVGLPKTGTTTIQGALVERAGVLAGHGVLVPGGRHAQRMAAFDLLGQRIPGDDSAVAGALDRLLVEINAYAGPRVVVSEEELGLARPRHVHRLVRALDGHRVFVVIGVRDLGRTLVSAWQQSVAMGSTTTWSEFVAGVREPGTGPTRAAAGFALRHDVLRVLDAWSAHVPADRIRLVTVPPRGAPSDVLLTRFARAADLPQGGWVDTQPVRNGSLGAAEVEMIRRLNEQLAGRLALRQLRHVIGAGIRPGLGIDTARPLSLPAEEAGWVRERAEEVVAELGRRGHTVYGDLGDLIPRQPVSTGRRLDDVSQAELLAATEAALAALAVAHGNLFRRYRRATGGQQPDETSLGHRVESAARAAVFRLQKATLTGADGNQVLGWAVRRYLARPTRLALPDTPPRERTGR
jgi:hypothetical protein